MWHRANRRSGADNVETVMAIGRTIFPLAKLLRGTAAGSAAHSHSSPALVMAGALPARSGAAASDPRLAQSSDVADHG